MLRYLRNQPQAPLAGELGPQTALCVRAKVNPKRLDDIVHGRKKCIDFDIADRLFCAMGLQGLWWGNDTQLSRIYNRVDLSTPGRSKLWEAEMKSATCALESCGRAFAYVIDPQNPGRKPKRYCSHRCAGLVGCSLGGKESARRRRLNEATA